MPPRQWKLRITDILDFIAAIQEYVRGMDFQRFSRNSLKIDAVEHRFTIIGEAANNVPAQVRQAHPEIPWASMSEMRNIVVHIYSGVKLDVVWETIRDDLPLLVAPLAKLLNEPE
jgi:uncharacterized protein with HEPN domain